MGSKEKEEDEKDSQGSIEYPGRAVPAVHGQRRGAGAGVHRQAQSPGTVRAEGITEVVADIELRCGRPTGDNRLASVSVFRALIDIAVELNTNITNEISDTSRVVKFEPVAYQRYTTDTR